MNEDYAVVGGSVSITEESTNDEEENGEEEEESSASSTFTPSSTPCHPE